jgi:hypothetical protein
VPQQAQLEPATGKGDQGNLEEPPEELTAAVLDHKAKQTERSNAALIFELKLWMPCHLTVTKKECGCAKPGSAVGQERLRNIPFGM